MDDKIQDVSEEDNSQVEEFDDLSLDDIEYEGESLSVWQDRFTIILPNLPCTSYQITQKMIDLNNAYQKSYNCYNKLLVLSSQAEKRFKQASDLEVAKLIKGYTDKGVSKFPTYDKLEILVLANNESVKSLYELYQIYSSIRDFFLNNKNKLEKSMNILKDISYGVNQSDSRFYNNKEGHGL